MLGLFPHLGKWHDFLLLWLDNISVEVTFSFFIHGRLDCFRIVAVGSNTAVNTLVQTSLQDRDVSLFSCVHRRGLDASRGSSTSGFRETSTLFSWRLHRFTLPPAVQEGPLFSTSVVVLVTSYLFDSGHSGGCGLISRRGLVCVSLLIVIGGGEHLSGCLLVWMASCFYLSSSLRMSVTFCYVSISLPSSLSSKFALKKPIICISACLPCWRLSPALSAACLLMLKS